MSKLNVSKIILCSRIKKRRVCDIGQLSQIYWNIYTYFIPRNKSSQVKLITTADYHIYLKVKDFTYVSTFREKRLRAQSY